MTFANETGFQSDHSSTESPTSTTEIDHVFDDHDSANFKDEVDDFRPFSLILLILVARNHHRKVTLKDLIAALTASLIANKMKQMTLSTNLKQAMKIWWMIIFHFTKALKCQDSGLSCW